MASRINYNAFANDEEALAWARAYASRSSSNSQPTTSSHSTQQSQQTTSGQSHQTNMQIVLEPAGNDFEEGGGDDQDSRKMACERCKKIKVKCEYPTGAKTCNRCAKMALTCVPGKPKERRVRPQLSAYDQVMDMGSSK
ncbi:hypothetical protein AGABI1DRAFT_128986 [Agaricus bisporus var. burnettii JB137-S8]|uniref:Zn(2)-C6 fungal-type domain-containing protein n=1 Tax=Agaricus bisporus var. burnettii (strain JB137-S8 / ATCC MYA-4627 / FGSC 10392) TaxID=597362 RepID=K5WTG5_AGABU|nr:uncharacterized protein AGABI1DRAFT_128986 [Agaricus bisporus var. burnettii JB137-S8]EKM78701.1 hypothetical protein AGABI1DRAFT_128986 [Agaricus bisporus var. burnettii JB137-S8]